jgi:hypothetical protein
MDQNEKTTNDKINKLESEIKVLKNEVQAVLLDLRESYLNVQNPFNVAANPGGVQPIVINQQAPAQEPRSEPVLRENPKPEPVEPDRDSPAESVPVTGLGSEIAREEVKMAPVSRSESETRRINSCEPVIRNDPKLDLVTVAGLTGWVEDSSKKLGRERTEAVLDISEVMGYVSADLKPIILKLIALAPQSSIESPPRTRDYIDSLIQINSLLGKDNREETALLLLSLVSGDKNHG